MLLNSISQGFMGMGAWFLASAQRFLYVSENDHGYHPDPFSVILAPMRHHHITPRSLRFGVSVFMCVSGNHQMDTVPDETIHHVRKSIRILHIPPPKGGMP